MTREQISRARQLVAELSALLDAMETPAREQRAQKRALPPAAAPVRPEVEAAVRRGMRRRGVVA